MRLRFWHKQMPAYVPLTDEEYRAKYVKTHPPQTCDQCGRGLPPAEYPLFQRHVCECGQLHWVDTWGMFPDPEPGVRWRPATEEEYRRQLGGAMGIVASVTHIHGDPPMALKHHVAGLSASVDRTAGDTK